MNKFLKGQGGAIEVYDNDSILIKIMWQKNLLKFDEIVHCEVIDNPKYDNLIVFEVYPKNKQALSTTLYKSDKSAALEITSFINSKVGYIKENENNDIETFLGNIILDYDGGHPKFLKSDICIMQVTDKNIELSIGNSKDIISMDKIDAINFETQEQIERRYTATRIFALGIFALAFKKKKKTVDKYLTIDYVDDNGIDISLLFSGSNSQKAYSLVYDGLSSYRRKNTSTKDNINNTTSNLDEIKKLKELLDIGAITQDEFDVKKKQLLDL